MNPDDLPPELRDMARRVARERCHDMVAHSARAVRLAKYFVALTVSLGLFALLGPLLYASDWAFWRVLAKWSMIVLTVVCGHAARALFQAAEAARRQAEIQTAIQGVLEK